MYELLDGTTTEESPGKCAPGPDVRELALGPVLITPLLAAAGSAAIYLVALPAAWRLSWAYGLVFVGLGAVQIGTAAAVLAQPRQFRVLLAAAAALVLVVLWALTQIAGVLPAPDPWVSVNSVIGFTDYLCVGLAIIGLVGLAAVAVLKPSPGSSHFSQALVSGALAPLAALVLLGIVVGVIAGSGGFAGAGLPAATAAPWSLPAGQMSTVEYCRPDAVPLAMDIYAPPAASGTGRPAPVALYVHGGGLVLGDRKMFGAGALVANHQGALFTPLQQQLNAQGYVVVSIDYRLAPGTPWPAQIEDAKCAVRFLRAHASDLNLDPARIAVWGSSAGGQLASLLGLAGPGAGFDRGQYTAYSSAVQAVVDMFGPSDLTGFDDADLFPRFLLQIGLGSSMALRRSASPITYVAPGAPPFLILQGTSDPATRPQSSRLVQRLHAAGVSATLIEVQGAGHTLITPGQRPAPDQLTAMVVDFLTTTLG